jgi:polysaccharide export outer membrane protein
LRTLASLLLALAPLAAFADDAYRIGPEDVLEISVWKEEALKKDVLVRPDGAISFPLAGDLQAGGRTVAELREELAQRLAKFIPDPVVSVLVNRVASNKIYVIGRVARPGDFAAGRYVDVLQALATAGGLNPFADEKAIKVIRKQGGRDVVFPFDFSAVSRGEKLEQNIRLQGGDVVVVP